MFVEKCVQYLSVRRGVSGCGYDAHGTLTVVRRPRLHYIYDRQCDVTLTGPVPSSAQPSPCACALIREGSRGEQLVTGVPQGSVLGPVFLICFLCAMELFICI